MTAETLYDRLVRRTAGTERGEGLPRAAAEDVAGNGLRQVLANTLQAVGDQVVNAKTVLPWLLAAVGAPAVLVGLLVPVRESGSMLPQAGLLPLVRRRARRSPVWVVGAVGQAASTAVMALAAALLDGALAGVVVVLALAVLALSRALNSLVSKDVLGRTVPKGQRGQINGLATTASGAVAIVVGLLVRTVGGDAAAPLAALLAAAALMWVLAAGVYAGIREPADTPAEAPASTWWADTVGLLRGDPVFRRFVLVRTLLLVSALSPPFVVALAARQGGSGLAGLGPFIIASGVASLVGGRIFGRLADRSSRTLMVGGAAAATVVLAVFLLILRLADGGAPGWFFPLTYLVLALTHTGVRVARKTYVVDVAEGDRRTEYVAVSNTAMGILLLLVGAVSSALALAGPQLALLFLAVLGLAGVVVGRTLPEVSAGG